MTTRKRLTCEATTIRKGRTKYKYDSTKKNEANPRRTNERQIFKKNCAKTTVRTTPRMDEMDNKINQEEKCRRRSQTGKVAEDALLTIEKTTAKI